MRRCNQTYWNNNERSKSLVVTIFYGYQEKILIITTALTAKVKKIITFTDWNSLMVRKYIEFRGQHLKENEKDGLNHIRIETFPARENSN